MSLTWPPHLGKKLDYPEVAAGAILAGSARRFGDHVAFRHNGAELSYEQLWLQACQFANGLVSRGVKAGDRVALRMPNCLPFPVAYYGLLLAAATFVPVNPLMPEPVIEAQLADAGAVLAVRSGDVAGICAGQPDSPPAVEIDIYRDLAHLAYTGGTTGRSKGVRLPHRNVVVNTLQFACWQSGSVPALDDAGGLVLDQVSDPAEYRIRLGQGSAINLTPWFHAMGTIGGLNILLLTGFTAILHDRFDPAAYLADAAKYGINYMGGAPALFAALLACPDFATTDLTRVLAVGSGAAPMPHEMTKALQRKMPDAVIAEGYGLTEVTMGVAASPCFTSGLRKVGTVGVPVFDTEVKLAPVEGGTEEVPLGERGEICVRGPQVMLGYLNRPEETAQTLVDGWLHTGDIGVFDEDGFLSIVDRKKDMLIYKGYNVYPRELEELLIAHPDVAMAAVVGRKSDDVGELPVAFVVPSRPDVRAGDVMAAINEQVVPYKRLREVIVTDQLPVSAAGKILKRELRDRLG
ncbi:class I adenylate-forming enzyme family protein [Kibdelosporangium phytohabitans]|uniref:Acyl-CoA synthetase n=1 Tax=Kibdelosporangium phytohabitans TaxID=860235 RepID=A0A0N9IBM3_9PSEU|nr:AMP-binding protein [Kibdelosporangium phytohabitans]ALG13622.1 acyl-CoA synthetase [Kibdelosporangium phytohabitans]MBE1465502.1 long-chain acyl-CoA synthetase [Kibdelosporangium phytohabitans]